MQRSNRRIFLQTVSTVAFQRGGLPQTPAPQLPKHRDSGAIPVHEKFIRRAIEPAASARKNGNHPFGALLVDENGQVMITAENTTLTKHDATRHAELNLVQLAPEAFSSAALSKATLHTSTEPCLMCCGAIHWARIPSVVFGCSAKRLASIVRSDHFLFPCRETFMKTKQPRVVVIGPVLETEAIVVHRGFWK